MSHFLTKGERGGKCLLMPLKEGKRNELDTSLHKVVHTVSSETPCRNGKMIFCAAKNGASN